MLLSSSLEDESGMLLPIQCVAFLLAEQTLALENLDLGEFEVTFLNSSSSIFYSNFNGAPPLKKINRNKKKVFFDAV